MIKRVLPPLGRRRRRKMRRRVNWRCAVEFMNALILHAALGAGETSALVALSLGLISWLLQE